MIFENVFFMPTLYVLLTTFVLGFFFFLFFFIIAKRRHARLSQYKANFFKASVIGGLTTSIFLTIVISTITPSLITVYKDYSHTETLSFFSNGEFIGIGGCYITNNSNSTLRLVGIDVDSDIDVKINKGCTEKVRCCPEKYFVEIPDHRSSRVVRTSKGRRKTINGPSVFLVKY